MSRSEQRKALWANPEWRERQLGAIQEGLSRSPRPTGRPSKGGTPSGSRMIATVGLPPEVFEACRSHAKPRGKSLAEILRTFIEWGLEQEGISQ